MKYIINNYQSILDLKETQVAIKLVKDTFEEHLANNLHLLRVSAPIFVDPLTGLNDNLTGKEVPVSFQVHNKELEIVHSLAKWKRYALYKYHFNIGEGLYTDMNAIRPFEEIDNLHSYYVDQWDWEKVIGPNDRHIDYLKEVVNQIYDALLKTEDLLSSKYPQLKQSLPKGVFFITTSELAQMYPALSPKERENAICEKHQAVFLLQIGGASNHDDRASDYDDWELNGDLLVWYEPLHIALELSSMGIRVNKESLIKQLTYKNELFKKDLAYHQLIIDNSLPLTIGGGIGQSRICMYMLKKAHIGEVQSSYWDEDEIKRCQENHIHLL